jgi:hypothetical protein
VTTRRAIPGFGDHAVIRNPVTGREWIVEVLYWGTTGSPFATDLHTAERRWFPPHWVAELEAGPGPRPCTCRRNNDVQQMATGLERIPDPNCDQHITVPRRLELTR